MKPETKWNDIEVRSYFATPIVFAELENAEKLNLELRNLVIAHRDKNQITADAAEQSWCSDWDFPSWGGRSALQLLETFSFIGRDMTQTRPSEDTQHPEDIKWSINAQALINGDGETNRLRAHPNCFWSSIYFLDNGGTNNKSPQNGKLELLDPRGSAPVMYSSTARMNIPGGDNAGRYHQIRPKSGLMVIFPSWLMHGFTGYRGSNVSVSIAINLYLAD